MIDYDKFWEEGRGTQYNCSPTVRLYRDIILDTIKEHKLSGRVLDVGCGDGYILSFLNKKQNKLFGIDISKKAIEIAKTRIPYGEFFVKDFSKKIIFHRKFDLIICSHTLEHIKDEKEVINNGIYNLKIGGKLLCATKISQFLLLCS